MSEKDPKTLGCFLEFYKKAYLLNLQTRWNDTPHMSSFASQEKLESIGKFESVSGHIWGCQLLTLIIKKTNPALRRVINFESVNDRLTMHDIGEALRGDISLTSRTDSGFDMDKKGEREDYLTIIDSLPEDIKKEMLKWHDEFEGEGDDTSNLEVLFARWVDSLQGNLTAQIFGNDLSDNSEVIEKVMRIRSVIRSKNLLDALLERSGGVENDFYFAALEVKTISKENISMVKELGIKVDFSDLGF